MHPAKDGFAALPFFDDFDLSEIDILLISQYVQRPSPFPFCELVGFFGVQSGYNEFMMQENYYVVDVISRCLFPIFASACIPENNQIYFGLVALPPPV